MKNLRNLNSFLNIGNGDSQKKEFMNLRVSTRGTWNSQRRFI